MFQVGSACYQTALAANQVIASAQNGVVTTIGTKTYVVTPTTITDSAITYVYRHSTGTGDLTQTFQSIPAQCALLTAPDAMKIAWLIAAAWIAIYAVTYIIRIINAQVIGVNTNDT